MFVFDFVLDLSSTPTQYASEFFDGNVVGDQAADVIEGESEIPERQPPVQPSQLRRAVAPVTGHGIDTFGTQQSQLVVVAHIRGEIRPSRAKSPIVNMTSSAKSFTPCQCQRPARRRTGPPTASFAARRAMPRPATSPRRRCRPSPPHLWAPCVCLAVRPGAIRSAPGASAFEGAGGKNERHSSKKVITAPTTTATSAATTRRRRAGRRSTVAVRSEFRSAVHRRTDLDGRVTRNVADRDPRRNLSSGA
jgi:hypothetical protein